MTPTLTFYNSLTRRKESFLPIAPPRVTLYTCGPTVYHFVHIGNLRTFVFEDLLRRTLQFFHYQVEQAMNLTDVDDKTIRGALAEKVSLDTFTARYKQAFFEDLQTLNIARVEHYPEATGFIPQMIGMIERLLHKGVAYVGHDKSVYYAIDKFPPYGCLSHIHQDQLRVGASNRVAVDEYDKEHAADFVLWKAYDAVRDGDIFWASPFGPGRPGWHLECSAMAMALLGQTIDIHVGGIDNLFPHHENEIAQSEAYSGKPFVHYWMHAEHLVVEGKKMSKSLGNFYTLRDLLAKGYTGPAVRYLLLQTHYKTPLNFTFAGLEGAKHARERLQFFFDRMRAIAHGTGAVSYALVEQTKKLFIEALADDLNISAALAALFDLVREANGLADGGRMAPEEAAAVVEAFLIWDKVLGLLDQAPAVVPEEVTALFHERQQARQEKAWAKADALRQQISALGYTIEDTPTGPRLRPN